MALRPAPLGETPAPTYGLRRPAPLPDAVTWDARSDPEKEVDATLARTGAILPTLQGVSRSLLFNDQAGASEAYARARAAEERAAALDSDVNPNLLEAESFGEGLAGLRKLAIQSSPSLGAALAGGVAGSAVGGRLARGTERRAAQRALDPTSVPVGTRAARAATPEAAALQRQDDVRRAAARAVDVDPAAQARIARSSRTGTFAGATAAGTPVLLPESREYLEGADQGDTAKILAANVGAAALGAIPAERLLGRVFRTPLAQEGVRQTLARAPARVLKELGLQAGSEGITEAGQTFLQRAGHKWVDENVELLSPEALQEYALSAVGGAALGGALGGSVEAGRVAPGAARGAARWAWDATGDTRQKVRDYIEKTAAKTQGAVDAGFARMDAATGGAEGRRATTARFKGDAADLFRQAREAAGGATSAASAAGKRFWQNHVKRQRQDDIDAIADEVMTHFDEVLNADDSSQLYAPALAKRGLLQGTALSIVNQQFLADVHQRNPQSVDMLARALEKHAKGETLSAPQAKIIANLINNPASGVTEAKMYALGFMTKNGLQKLERRFRKMSETPGIEQEAPRANLRSQLGASVEEAEAAVASDVDTDAGIEEDVEGGLDLRSLSGGMSEGSRAAGERAATADRLTSLVESGRTLRQRAATDPDAEVELRAVQDEYRKVRDQLRNEILDGKAATWTANYKTDQSRTDFERRESGDMAPGFVTLAERKKLDGGGERKQLLSLATLIQRQRAKINAEGSTDEDIPAKTALLRGLSEALMAGVGVELDTLKPGGIFETKAQKSRAGKTEYVRGRRLMVLDERTIAELKNELAKIEGDTDITPANREAQQDRLDQEFARAEGEEALMGEDVVDSGQVDDGRELVARRPPPGVNMGDGFVSSIEDVADVRTNAPYANIVAKARREYAAAKTPRARRNVQVAYGTEIGTAELQRALDSGTMSQQRYDVELAKLRAANGEAAIRALFNAAFQHSIAGQNLNREQYRVARQQFRAKYADSPAKYLADAGAGRFDSASVTHARTDDAAVETDPKRRDEARFRIEDAQDDTAPESTPLPKQVEDRAKVKPRSTKDNPSTEPADLEYAEGRAPKYPKWASEKGRSKGRATPRKVERKPADKLKPERKPRQVGGAEAPNTPRMKKAQFLAEKRQAREDRAAEAARQRNEELTTSEEAINRISADLRARAAKADDAALRQMVSQIEARIRGGDATEEALDAMRDDRAYLLDVLAQRVEAANAKGVESLTSKGEHDVEAEGQLANAWLDALGIKHTLTVEALTKHMILGDRTKAEAGLTSGRLGGQHAIGRGQKADKARIRLNPHLHGAERVSVLAHEVGHHVVFHELAKALKRPFTDVVRMSDADLLAAMREHRPDIAADYDAWLAKRGGASTVPVQQSSSPIDRVLGHEARGEAVGRVTSFNEWLADNVAKALLGKRETQSAVGKFFKDVAEALQKTYDMIFRSGAFKQYRPAKSVEAWVNDLFDANVAAVKAATGASTDAKGARATVTAAVEAAVMRDAAENPPPGAPPAGAGGAATLPPDPARSLRAMMRFVRNGMPPEERRILDRATNTPAVRKVVDQMVDGHPHEVLLRKMLNSSRFGVEARIALAYFAHVGGALATKVGPKTQSALLATDDTLLGALGLAGNGRLAERVFNDIASGVMQKQGKDYSARKREGLVRGKRQRVLNNAMRRWETLSDAIGIALDGKARRMMETSVPALRRIAGLLQKPTGAFDDDRGLIPAVRNTTARFGNRVNKAFAGLTETQAIRAMRFMQRGDTDLSQLKPDVRRAVVQTRALMDELYGYMKDAGVEVGRRENFFPILFNPAQVNFDAKLEKLLSDPDYEQPIREFLEAAKASRGKDVKQAKKAAKTPKRIPPPIDPKAEAYFERLRNSSTAGVAATNASILDAMRTGDIGAIEKFIVAAEKRAERYEAMDEPRADVLRAIALEIRYARARIKQLNEAPIDEAATAQAEAASPATAPIDQLIKDMVRSATGEPGEVSAADGAPNFRGMNFRSMEFIERLYHDAVASGDAERIARHRKNVEAFAKLQARDPADVVARYIVPLVKNAEHTRRFGEDGARLEKMLTDAKTQGATEAQINEARNAVLASVGAYGLDKSPTLAAISPGLAERFSGEKTKAFVHGMQAYQNLRLLPLSLISSLVEPVGIAVRAGGSAGVAWKGFKDGVRSLYDGATRDELRQALDVLGATDDMFAEVAIHQDNTKFTHKVNTWLFKWNGLTAWTRATRYMALTAAHGFLLKHGGAAPNEHSARYLSELGLRAGDVQPDGNGRVLLESGDAKRDQRVREALMQFVDEAVIRPNSQQTPMWVSDPYMGLFAQYKAFAYAMYDQIPGRVAHEFSHGNHVKPVAAALAYLPVIMMAELLRELIQNLGEDERRKNWGFDEYAWLAVTRSGMIAPRTGAAMSAVEDVQRRNLPGTSALGPTGQQARDVYRAFTGQRSLGEEAQRALPLAAAHRRWDEALAARGGN